MDSQASGFLRVRAPAGFAAGAAVAPSSASTRRFSASLSSRAAIAIALTVVLVVLLWWIRRGAALLMLPFLAWLCFAALTLLSIASLNPDAGEVAPRPASTDIVL